MQGKVVGFDPTSLNNDECSKPLGVTCGIPQGSCLGALLFIIYLNGFEDGFVYSSLRQAYADDTHTTIASDNIDELTQMMKELQSISEWIRANKSSVNPKKTEFMPIGVPRIVNKTKTLALLNFNGIGIKSLGVVVDDSLSWEEHFKSLNLCCLG